MVKKWGREIFIFHAMRLVMLHLDSGAKLAVGQWIVWWSVCLGDLAVGGSFVFYLIIVVIFLGPGRAYSLQGILKLSNVGQGRKEWDHFYGWSWPLKTPSKDFNLTIVRLLGGMKWLKNGAGKFLYFMQLFLHYILSGENFIG